MDMKTRSLANNPIMLLSVADYMFLIGLPSRLRLRLTMLSLLYTIKLANYARVTES